MWQRTGWDRLGPAHLHIVPVDNSALAPRKGLKVYKIVQIRYLPYVNGPARTRYLAKAISSLR